MSTDTTITKVLSIEQCDKASTDVWRHESEKAVYKQLADCMRENAALLEDLQHMQINIPLRPPKIL